MSFIKLVDRNAGLEPAVFAAMVPNSADKPISELMEEIMGDHELLVSESQNTSFSLWS